MILAGVHAIKTLKAKLRSEQDEEPFDASEDRYNSPWNIAIDFNVDLSFHPGEIMTMLQEYKHDKQIFAVWV